MRHRRLGRKLGVVTKHRRAMLRNMVTDFFRNERIKSTDTRLKELKRLAEKMITLAKLGTLHARRQAGEIISDKGILKKLFDEIGGKYKERPGGYTRIVKLGMRRGDNAPLSVLELVEGGFEQKGKKKKTKTSKDKQKSMTTRAPESRSRKKEAAEELGLIEQEQKSGEISTEEVEPSSEPKKESE